MLPIDIPYLTPDMFRPGETWLIDAIVRALPEFAWLWVVPEYHLTDPLLQAICAMINHKTGAKPPTPTVITT